MTGNLPATAAAVFIFYHGEIPEPRNKPGKQEERSEHKQLVPLQVRLHAANMPTGETAANLPLAHSDPQCRGDCIEEERDTEKKIHQHHLEYEKHPHPNQNLKLSGQHNRLRGHYPR